MTGESAVRVVLRVIALLVPAHERADWRREWEAELAFDLHRQAPDRRRAAWRLARIMAASQHAVFLRFRRRGGQAAGAWFGLRDDFRYSLRGIRRTPLFSITVILTLALGVGLVTGILAFADGYLFRPLPFPGADRAFYLRDPNARIGGLISATDARVLQESDLANYGFVQWSSSSAAFREIVVGGVGIETFPYEVSQDFRKTLELPLTAGRDFAPDDHREGAPLVAWLGYRFWQRAFGGDVNVIHQTLRATGPRGSVDVRIVGVLGPEVSTFDLNNRPPDLVVPARGRPREGPFMLADPLVRLPPYVSVEQATQRIAAVLQAGSPASDGRPRTVRLISLQRVQLSGGAPTARILMVGAALVMLLATMNLIHLLLGRGELRATDAITRVALGASRWRITRAMMVESLVLGLVGISLGLIAGKWLALVLADRLPVLPTAGRNLSMMPVLFDGRVMTIGATLGIIAACVGGWWPARRAWRASLDARFTNPGRRSARLARLILASELMVVTIVAAGAVFSGTGIHRYLTRPLGFELTDRVQVTLTRAGTRLSPQEIQLALDAVKATGGVKAASSDFVPLPGQEQVEAPGVAIDPKQISAQAVPPDQYEAWGWKTVEGRWFHHDEFDRTDVAVVNEHFAKLAWPSGGAVGATVRTGTHLRTIIGVIASHQRRLDAPLRPGLFVPVSAGAAQPLIAWAPNASADDIQARIAAAVESAVPGARARATVLTFDTFFARGIGEARFQAPIVATFGVLAAILAVVGVFGIVSFLTSQRTREFGIRLALGARRGDIHFSVLRESLGPAAFGVIAGALGAWGLSRVIQSAIFQWEASGTLAVVVVVIGLLGVAVVAALAPAARAGRIDPVSSLRD